MSNIGLLLLVCVIGGTSAKPNNANKIADMDKQMTEAASKKDAYKDVLTEPASGIKVVVGNDESQEDLDDQDADDESQDNEAVSDEELENMLDTKQKDASKAKKAEDQVAQKAESGAMVAKASNANEDEEEEVKTFDKRGKINSYQRNFAYVCPSGRSFSTLLSAFNPTYKDRQWSATCDRYIPSGYTGPKYWSTNYGYDNEYKGTLNAYCPPQAIMTGLAGYFHGSPNYDRRYKIYCTHVWHHKKVSCRWSPYMNNYKESAHFTLNCNSQYYIAGIQGYFHSSYYDRRFRVYMCKLQKI